MGETLPVESPSPRGQQRPRPRHPLRTRRGLGGSLRARLVASHLLPLLIVVILVGVAFTYLLETQVLLAGLSTELERQALLISSLAGDLPSIWINPNEAQDFAAGLDPRLTADLALIDADGVLLASTDPDDIDLIGRELSVPGLREVLITGAVVRVDYGERPGAGAAEVLAPVVVGRQIVGAVRLVDPLSSVYERFPRTRAFIVGILVAGLLVGAIVGWVLAVGIERPLGRTARAIGAMADGAPLRQLPEQGPAEVRGLVRAFNTLAVRLQTLERTRQRLLANLVHELGRPLGALLSATEALAGGADQEPELRDELVDGMEAEIRRMRSLLDDLVHLYDRALGALELDRHPVDLRAWLLQAIAPWREAALAQSLEWRVEVPAALPEVSIDPDRIAQALGNILSNAIKFSPPGGEVVVSAGPPVVSDAQLASVWISVTDTGPGIPPEEQDRIFAPFYRGATGRRFPQGMGLGLSIARDIVEAHGGRIELESSRARSGTTFTLHLPHTQ